MLVRYGKHKQIGVILGIDDAVRKAPQPATTNLRCERMPCLRKSIDQLQRLKRFDQESVAQSGSLPSVPSDSLLQLILTKRRS